METATRPTPNDGFGGLAATASAAQDETTALEALKAQINDPTCPTLDLARALETHRTASNLSQSQLAEKLGMLNRRPYFTRILGLLELPKEVVKDFEGKVFSEREIKEIMHQFGHTRVRKGVHRSPLAVHNGVHNEITQNNDVHNVVHKDTPDVHNGVHSEIPQNNGVHNGVHNDSPGHPLQNLKDRLPKRGEVSADAPKPISILIMLALVGLVFGFLELIFYVLSRRGYQALVAMEQRTGDYLASQGPEKVTLGLVQLAVVLFCVIFFWPQIKKEIYDIRHPQTKPPASQTTGGGGVIATTASPAIHKEAGGGNPIVQNNEIATAPTGPRDDKQYPRNDNPSPRASLVSANDATQVMQAVVPQTPGITQRLGNALAVIAGKTVSSGTSGASAASPGSNATPPPPFPGPANLQFARIPGSRAISLSWQAQGSGSLYNVYASYANDTPSFDRDGYLLRQTSVVWTPPTKGVQVFLFYVTVVNPQGQESGPSPRLLVDLR